jgi:hypothetical protein
MLAYPYGYPKLMLSYDYKGDTDEGGPSVPFTIMVRWNVSGNVNTVIYICQVA